LEYADLLEAVYRGFRIDRAKDELLSRVPGMLREADALEKTAREDIVSLGMDVGVSGERWDAERLFYFSIPDRLRGLRQEREQSEEMSAPDDAEEPESGRGTSFQEEESGLIRSLAAAKASLDRLGIRTDLTSDEVGRIRSARMVLFERAPSLRREAEAMRNRAESVLSRYGIPVPGSVLGSDRKESAVSESG